MTIDQKIDVISQPLLLIVSELEDNETINLLVSYNLKNVFGQDSKLSRKEKLDIRKKQLDQRCEFYKTNNIEFNPLYAIGMVSAHLSKDHIYQLTLMEGIRRIYPADGKIYNTD